MKKSFKKVIACILAVLMVTCSLPFTVLAAPGDYEPDIQLQFSPFYDAENYTWTSTQAKGADAYGYTGLYAFPIYLNSDGTLYADKDEMNEYLDLYEFDPADADWTLSSGNIFAVTIRFDNVDIAASGNVNIRFSDNLTPAGLYSTTKGAKTSYAFGSETNKPNGANEIVGFRNPVFEFSASAIYPGMNDTALKDLSIIAEDPFAEDGDGWSDLMMSATLVCEGDYIDVSSISSDFGFFDIKNHTINVTPDYDIIGYTYDNQFIVATFIFELTDDTKPVKFALQDPEGKLDEKLDTAAFFAKKSEGLGTENATTYAVNTFNSDKENPGSRKMTFMGTNENNLTVTFKDENGDVIGEPVSVGKGAKLDAPALPENGYNDDEHFTYGWSPALPETATESAVYQITKTSGAHDYDEGVTTQYATCAEEGQMTYTCTCGKTLVEPIEKIAHTPGEATRENIVDATCTVDGSYEEVVKCTECEAEISRTPKTIVAPGHTPGEAVPEEINDATCTVDGSYYEVVRCTVCGEEISRTPRTIDALGHTPAAAVQENRIEASCTVEGQYDEVVYCSVCNTELSREQKTISVVDHTYVATVTDPTCTEQGYTTFVCSVCNNTYVGEYVDALGHTPAAAVKENVVAATYDKEGSYDSVVYCSVCGVEISRTPVKVAKLAKTSLAKATVSGIKDKTYTGKALTQSVTVKLGSTTLKNGTDYKVAYKNNKSVGKATVTITGINKYSGTITKTFKINPKATTVSKVSAKSKGFKVTWKKQATQTTGYEIQYATNSKFTSGKKTVDVSKNSTTSKTVSKLKAKKKYYVRIRTYKKVGSTKYYSDWSKAKTVTTKK